MTSTFVTLIQSAELGTHDVKPVLDPRFAPTVRASLRELSARLLRAHARGSLELAGRLDPTCA